MLYNKTKTSTSIPGRLLREGRFYLIPVYYFLRTSFLAREGIEHSGSFHFADHIYKYEARGDYGIGTALDWVILRLPSARSFRNRYLNARKEVLKAVRELDSVRDEIHVMSLPAGIPRELKDVATILKKESPALFAKVRFHCMDLDTRPLEEGQSFIKEAGLEDRFSFRQGNALESGDYPALVDVVTSTGLADFLNDEQLVTFARNVHGVLRPGGSFITSGMIEHKLSDWLMRQLAELHTVYRDMDALERVISQTEFSRWRLYMDEVGIQSMLIARK